MERENQQLDIEVGNGNGNGGAMLNVVTGEQLDPLRNQIVEMQKQLDTLREQIVEMQTNLTPQYNLAAAFALSGAGRPWSPNLVQLQILESLFEQYNETPSRQRIEEIASELRQHGQISEPNVYNWFQNRRARLRRRRPNAN